MIPSTSIIVAVTPTNPFTAGPNPFHASLICCGRLNGGDTSALKFVTLLIVALVELEIQSWCKRYTHVYRNRIWLYRNNHRVG